MIDPAILNAYPATNGAKTHPAGAQLHMRRDPDARMAGSIPVWESGTERKSVSANPDFKTALSHNGEDYNAIEPALGGNTGAGDPEDEFGFEDLIDIINPLHHIPLVSIVYENLSGDTIKPAGRIIGGAVFGGFAGAAAGIANVIVKEETGKDMAGNVVAMIETGTLPQAKPGNQSPEDQLNQAAHLAFNDDITAEERPPLPAMALGLQHTPAQMSQTHHARYEYVRDEDGRMAGSQPKTTSRTQDVQPALPLPRTVLSDPASVNLAHTHSKNENRE